MKYNQNDYELLYLISEEDEDAKEQLYKKYESILRHISKSMYESCKKYNGVEYEDFYQEACFGLEKAIKSFDEQKNILFYTYVIACVRNQLAFYRRSITRKKDIPLNSAQSIYQEADSGLTYEEMIPSPFKTPYEVCEEREVEKKIRLFQNQLSFLDACIFELRYNGFQYKEISELLEIPCHRVSHCIQKIKRKRLYFSS